MSASAAPRPTVLILGATGLFGSKICVLLQRLSAASSSSSSPAAAAAVPPFRVAVASRTPASASALVALLKNQQQSSPASVEFIALDASVDVSQAVTLRAALQRHQPFVVVNATGAHAHLSVLAQECVAGNSSLVDLSEDVRAIDKLEETVAAINNYILADQQQQQQHPRRLLLCASGISTSPAITSACVNQILDDIEQRDDEIAAAAADNAAQQQEQQQQLQQEPEAKAATKQAATTAAPASAAKSKRRSFPRLRFPDREITVEIALCPGMAAIRRGDPLAGGINKSAGASTLTAIVSRVGTRFDAWRNARPELTAHDDAAFRNMYWHWFPPILLGRRGNRRLVSPFPSPDVKLGSALYLTRAKLERDRLAQAKFRSRHDPTLSKRVIDDQYGEDFVTRRSVLVGQERDLVREVAFVAGLELPWAHRLLAMLPDSILKRVQESMREQGGGGSSRGVLAQVAFRVGSLLGTSNGALQVRVVQHTDEMSRQSSNSRHRREERSPAAGRTVLVVGTDGAGVYLPALPAAMLVLKLLELETSGGGSLAGSNNAAQQQQQQQQQPVAFFDGVLRREHLKYVQQQEYFAEEQPTQQPTPQTRENGEVEQRKQDDDDAETQGRIVENPLPHPAVAALRFSEMERAIRAAFPAKQHAATGRVAIERSSCLFEHVVGPQQWAKVHPVVRAFHESGQTTAWCEDSIYAYGRTLDRRDRRFISFNALVHSPPPRNIVEQAVLQIAQLPHHYPKWTQFTINVVGDSFEETWIRRYPTVTMSTTMRAGAMRAATAPAVAAAPTSSGAQDAGDERCMVESLLGGAVELLHQFEVEPGTGALVYNVVGARALWGRVRLPAFLVPKVYARESCDRSGKFKFEIDATLPALLAWTRVQYTGTIATADSSSSGSSTGTTKTGKRDT